MKIGGRTENKIKIQKSKIKNMIKDKALHFFSRLSFFIFFILISLIIQIFIIAANTKKTAKQIITSKAQTGAFFGFNIHSLPLVEPGEIDQTLSMVSKCSNTTTVRFWGFSAGGEGYDARRFNAVDNIGKVLNNSPANMKFIITLSNYYSTGVFQPWPAAQDNPTNWFASDWKRNGFANFVNAVTTKYKGNPKILMWEIMNEPNCTPDAECSTAQHLFLKEISNIIAKNDPGKLISPGLQGQNTGGEHFDNGDYEAITQLPNISANSCHLYMGPASPNSNLSKANCLQALEITRRNNKLFYIGEFGGEYGCTSHECINTCPANTLQARKTEMMSVAKEFTDRGAGGVLIWQFSPERNSTLTCDGSSVFPGDPFCSITEEKTLETSQTRITFDPAAPKTGDTLKIIISANQGMVWVNLAGIDPKGKKFNLARISPKTSSDKNGFSWTYSLEKIVEGDYTFIFSDNCQKYNKQGQPLKDICDEKKTEKITVSKGSQTKNTSQNEIQPAQKEEISTALNISSPGKITLDISTIDPIDPYALEYCKNQTSNADCTNPHDQVVQNGTVTMSFPDGNPAIFCGSIPEKRRSEAKGSDRSCIVFLQKT